MITIQYNRYSTSLLKGGFAKLTWNIVTNDQFHVSNVQCSVVNFFVKIYVWVIFVFYLWWQNTTVKRVVEKTLTSSLWSTWMGYPEKYYFEWLLWKELLRYSIYIFFLHCTHLIYFCRCGLWTPFWIIIHNEQARDTKK